jgi:creatinine amidohydrolase
MDMLITTATAREEQDHGARVAVLPVGSFEQHGSFLPLITDTIVACLIARRLSTDHRLMLLPPVTLVRGQVLMSYLVRAHMSVAGQA